MLCPLSTLRLIQSRVIDKETLQKGLSLKAWNKIISRSSYDGEELLQMKDVRYLVRVLHFLELEEPSTFLLPLLDLICESRPRLYQVQMICPSHSEPHSITYEAFLLLEEVEGSFGTAEQSVDLISSPMYHLQEPLLSALSSRVARQRKMLTFVDSFYAFCRSSTIEAFTILMQAEKVEIHFLEIVEAIGGDGWHMLAKSVKGKPNVKFRRVSIVKEDLEEVRREDMKDIWDVTAEIDVRYAEHADLSLRKFSVNKSTFDWEGAWARLEQISSLTEDEFFAEYVELVIEASDEDLEYEGGEVVVVGEDDEEEEIEGEGDEEDEIEDQEPDGEEGDEEDV